MSAIDFDAYGYTVGDGYTAAYLAILPTRRLRAHIVGTPASGWYILADDTRQRATVAVPIPAADLARVRHNPAAALTAWLLTFPPARVREFAAENLLTVDSDTETTL